ncbi:MAG: type III secretion system chaperone, partial [Pseudomonadota bacterium]
MLAEAQFDRVFEEFVAANDLDLRLEAGTVAFSIGDWTFMIVVSSMGDAVTISAELGTVIEDPLHRMEAHLAERNTVLGPAFGLYYGIEAESRLIRLMQTRAVLGMSPESLGAMIDDFVGVVALERQELAVFLPALLRRADREAPAAAPGDEPWLRLWRRSLMSGVSGKGPPSRTTMSTTGRLSGSKRRAGALSNPAKRARTVKSPATLGKPVFPRLTQNATSGQITVVSESRERPSTGLIHKGRQIQGDHTTCFLALRHELRNAVLDTSPDEAMANLQATYDHDMALPGYGATPKWVTDPDIDSFASRFLQ